MSGVHTCVRGASGAVEARTSSGFTSPDNKNRESNSRCSTRTKWVLEVGLDTRDLTSGERKIRAMGKGVEGATS